MSILCGKVVATGEIAKSITPVFTSTGSGTKTKITAVKTGATI
jgi:hypothetical protein